MLGQNDSLLIRLVTMIKVKKEKGKTDRLIIIANELIRRCFVLFANYLLSIARTKQGKDFIKTLLD